MSKTVGQNHREMSNLVSNKTPLNALSLAHKSKSPVARLLLLLYLFNAVTVKDICLVVCKQER